MRALVSFETNDVGLTKADMTLVVHDLAGALITLNNNWTMTEISLGVYEVNMPSVTVDSVFTLAKTSDPTVIYEGSMFVTPLLSLRTEDVQEISDVIVEAIGNGIAGELWSEPLPGSFASGSAGYEIGRLRTVVTSFIDAIGMLLSQTYKVGQIASPYSPLTGIGIIVFAKTNYLGITVVGEKWFTVLSTPGVRVFFTAKSLPGSEVNIIDVEGVITDVAHGVISIALNKKQTDIKVGDYFWQLEARTYTEEGNPIVHILNEVWMMQEGKLYVKPSFKV
jgi:hypothetical protein